MYSLLIEAEVKESKKNEFLQSCEHIINNLLVMSSGEKYTIEQNFTDVNKFCLRAKFESKEEFEEHLKSDSFKILHGAMKLLTINFNIQAYTEFTKYSSSKISEIINHIE